MQAEETLPNLLIRNVGQWPDQDAIREKEYGIWQTYSWQDYAEQVFRFARGLAQLGFKRGDKLAVIGDNRPHLYFAMVAAQCLGGISLALYQDSIARELSFVIDHAETKFIVAENEEQVDKLVDIRESIPQVEKVIFDDPRGLGLLKDPWLIHFPEVQKLGDDFEKENPGYVEAEIAKVTAEDIAIFCYTSGTTGQPKGVMLSHENLIGGGKKMIDSEGWNQRDEMVAYLPMAWIGDFVFSVVGNLYSGAKLNCIESRETYRRDTREIGPTLFIGPPGQWEGSGTTIQVRMNDADWLKRSLFNKFIQIGIRVEKRLQAGLPVPFGLRIGRAMGELLIYSPLRDLMGGRNMRMAYSGGAPLGPDLIIFFRAFGVNLKQLYAMTESSAICTMQPDGEASAETMGKPLPGVDVKISEDGEILVKGVNIFKGYYKNEEATRDTLDEDGWLATGDAGFIDRNGHLKVIDRAKDVGRLVDGTMFAPQFLENKLKFSPYVREAVVLGSERDYATAMINIDLESLENWAERKDLVYTNYQDLSQKQEVYELIHGEIVQINHRLAQDKELAGVQIKRFLILNKELDPDDGEITRTRKIRRKVIGERYGVFIDALYSGAKDAAMDIQVTYEDGRAGNFASSAAIWDVSEAGAAAS